VVSHTPYHLVSDGVEAAGTTATSPTYLFARLFVGDVDTIGSDDGLDACGLGGKLSRPELKLLAVLRVSSAVDDRALVAVVSRGRDAETESAAQRKQAGDAHR
jgi:hypothetical protein